MIVKRFDRYDISGGAQVTPYGLFKAPAYVTRVGVLKYRREDGAIQRELRLPEEVFNETSLATLKGIPVTNEHPEGLVEPSNIKQHIVGYTGDTVDKIDDTYVQSMLTIFDESTIAEVNNGKSEVSCGYECELEPSPGEWKGERYDVIQRKISYNHLATVARGRAGREVSLKLDSEDAILFEGEPLMKIMIGDVEYEVADEVGKAFMALKEKAESADPAPGVNEDEGDMPKKDEELAKKDEELAKMKEDMDALEARADSFQSEIKQLKAKKVINLDSVKAEAKKYSKAVAIADKLKVEHNDSMDTIDVMRAVVKADSEGVELTGKSNVYIEARFDAVSERLKDSDTAATNVGKGLLTTKRADSETAREAYLNRLHGKN